ncbi:hypothetical protein [Roseateles saccharophilus]|uniref:hypothetical protein n=1 Tax=Roseateles saccharophilus TaxID=304 RepID=UPI0010510EA3|nr:hypothetical protein [Roseateles saccharophilus]MDG0834311.1 hypothetical protein [Roseateles saccharophilus]
MSKKALSPTLQLAKQRLQKVAVKRVVARKAARAQFLAQLRATEPTEETRLKASQLVESVRAAKAADFLQQYRIVV